MTTRAKPKADSRAKGASFERDVARALELELGIHFKRDLEQVRTEGRGDLVADDPGFPFLIECKRYATGINCKPAWKAQACKAADAARLIPAVVFKFDRQDMRVAVPLSAIEGYFGVYRDREYWAEVTLEGFCYVARELMAGAK